MEEKMADVERRETQVVSRKWLESQVARTRDAFGEMIDYWKGLPRGAKLKLATSFLVPASLGTLSAVAVWRFHEGRIELSSIPPVEGKETTIGVSQAQTEAPEIVVPSEAPTQDFLVQIQAPEPIIPPKKEAEVEVISYEVQPGDTLIDIAKKYNLPWQVFYGKNITQIGYNPDDIKAGIRLDIPDTTRDKELIKKLNPQRISEERFPSIDLLTRQDPEKLKELRWRAVAVVAYDLNERQIFFEDWREFRDFRILDFHGKGKELNYSNVLETLAWYELEFERNPAIEQVLQEMSPGIRVMNEILMDKASPEWFKDGKIPQLPEDLSGRFVFEGGILPGLGWPYYPSINPFIGERYDSYGAVRQRLPYIGFHELIHAIPQFESIIKANPWTEQTPEENRPGLLKPENRSAHLGHEAMDVLILPAMETMGFSPTKIDSRILYIYRVLKREGVTDPHKEMLSAALTMNGDRLWQVYEEVRLPSDYSMDELFTYQERSPDGYYESFNQEAQKKVLEELRAEYAPYLHPAE